MQNSGNTHIQIIQNIFVLKALFLSSNCIFMQLQGNYILVNCQGNADLFKNIYLFTKSIIIRGN